MSIIKNINIINIIVCIISSYIVLLLVIIKASLYCNNYKPGLIQYIQLKKLYFLHLQAVFIKSINLFID